MFLKISKKTISIFMAFLMIFTFNLSSIFAENSDNNWVGAWSTSPVNVNLKTLGNLIDTELPLRSITFRTRIQPTISGDKIRLTLSNKYGDKDLTINSMTVAKGSSTNARTIKPCTKKTVTYKNNKTIVIPAGQTIQSDPIDLKVNAFEYITTSIYIDDLSKVKTMGLIGGDTYTKSLNRANSTTFLGGIHLKLSGKFGNFEVIPVLTGLQVSNDDAESIVMIGDSTIANDVPLLLAKKLHNENITNISVLQQAIKGNRLLYPGAGDLGNLYGDSTLDRFDSDVLAQDNVKYIIVKVGLNDIIHPNCKSLNAPVATTEEIIAGYKTLIDKSHAANKKIYFCTRTSWNGYTRNILGRGDDVEWTPELEKMRIELNNWVMSDNGSDGYIDLSSLSCKNDPSKLKKLYTLDGVHLTTLGQKKLVDCIDTDLFK